MEPAIPQVMCRVVLFSLAFSQNGWRPKVGTFDTATTIPGVQEQIHEYALEHILEPGTYVATCSVIGGDADPSLHMYTFEVYEEDVLNVSEPLELAGTGIMLRALDVGVEYGVRPLIGVGTSCEESL